MTRLKLLLFLVLFFLIQPVFAEYYMVDAESSLNKGDYSEAIIQLKNQLKQYPKHSRARYLLGVAYIETGKVRFAEKELAKAYRLEQDNDSYRLAYARSLLLNNKFNEVMDLLETETIDLVLDGKRLMMLGSIAFAEQDYKQAEVYFQKAIKKGNRQATINLAKIALYKKDFKKANAFIDELLDKDPDNKSAWKVKAMILNLTQQYKQALEIYTRLINKNQNDYELYIQRAATLLSLNRFSEAETDINLILKKNSNLSTANFLMAKLRMIQKNYKQAEIFAERVLIVSAKHKASLFTSARANFELKNFNKAEKRLLEYLNLETDNINVHILLARIYLAQNETKSALLILESLPETIRNNNVEILKTLTIAYLSIGEFNKIFIILVQAQKKNPGNKKIKKLLMASRIQAEKLEEMINELESHSESYKLSKREDYLLLASYFQQSKYTKFKKQLAQFITKTPEDANLYVIQARYELYKKNNDAAMVQLNKALNYDRQHIPALRTLAKLAYDNRDYQLSKQYYQQIITINNKDFMAYLALAQLSEKEGDLLSAEFFLHQLADKNFDQENSNIINEIKKATALINFFNRHNMPVKKKVLLSNLIKNYPDNLLILAFVSDIYIKSGNYQQAEEIIRILINKDVKNIKYRLLLAALLTKKPGYEKESFELWDKAFNLDQTKPTALIAKYNYQLQKKRYKDALSTTKEIKDKFPVLNIAEKLEGNIYLLSEKKELALDSYQKAFQIQPDSQLAIKIMKLKVAAGSPDEDIDFLEEQLSKRGVDKHSIWLYLSEMYHFKKEYQKSNNYFQQYLIKNMKDPVLLSKIAWNYMLLNNSQAIILSERAYKMQPKSASIADIYGTILLKNNKNKKAIEILKKAVKLAPEDNNIQFHLAKAYYLQHDNIKAKTILKIIIQSDTDFSEKESAEKLLKKLF